MAQELDCQDLVEMVTDYFEDSLAADDSERLEAHLLECDDCDEYLAQMRTSLRLLGKVDLSVLSDKAKNKLITTFRESRQ